MTLNQFGKLDLSARFLAPRPSEKKAGLRRQKKASSVLLSLSRSVQELTEENRSLKEDLDRVLSHSPTVSRIQGVFPGPTGGGGGESHVPGPLMEMQAFLPPRA